jgi:two-component system, OmpR family, sensor kinase
VAVETKGKMTADERSAGRRVSLGLRGRVLGWYVLLLAIALGISSLLLFKAATIYQEDAAEQKLREEVFDFEAALAARHPAQSVQEAAHAHLAHWPREDREALIVRLAGAPPEAAGPVGPEPAIVRALEQASERRFVSLETSAGDARVLAAPIRVKGSVVGAVAAVHLTEEDRDELLLALATVLGVAVVALVVASLIAWTSVGRLLWPLKEIAATADAISREGDLSRTIPESRRQDEVGLLAKSFNRMLARLDAAFRRERRFISEASHELRTPITICRGHLEVLGPSPTPEEVRDATEVVIDELGRLGRIVEDMTTLARVDDPEFLWPRAIPLDDFMDEVGTKAEPLLDGRLAVERPPPGWIVRADRQRLTQALLNLLNNAAVHGNGGSVALRVVAERHEWRFEVADEAGGVPPDQEESLFRPFHRGTTRAAGRGLGLAIVRGIAEAHGGAAGVDNRPGKGATFWVRVPR